MLSINISAYYFPDEQAIGIRPGKAGPCFSPAGTETQACGHDANRQKQRM